MRRLLCRTLVPEARPWAASQRSSRPAFVRSFTGTRLQWSTQQQVNRTSRRSSAGAASFDRVEFDHSIRKNIFYIPSFDIYQGVGSTETRGLYDYGPPGCALQANIVDAWRKHFIVEEDMLEVDCASLTPYEVLNTSGHVDKFTDWMCRDSRTGESFRADHLLRETLESRLREDEAAREQEDTQQADLDLQMRSKRDTNKTKRMRLEQPLVQEYRSVLAQIDTYTGAALEGLISRYKVCSPTTGESVGDLSPFSLMFETIIGPKNSSMSSPSAFLRPETAQGQFLNFQKLFNYNQQSMPFASASVGKCYRNEISPRSGLLRVREFLLAEIEHFVDPEGGKRHARFHEVADVEMQLIGKEAQVSSDARGDYMTIAHAVSERIVDNETLGYFLARIQLFLVKCGVDPAKLRFRQHTIHEMAHYAADCWDAELLTSYGWIECVGCADRSAYDLAVHSKRSGQSLKVREQLDSPHEVERFEVELNRKLLGPRFRKSSKAVEDAILALDQTTLKKLAGELSSSGHIEIRIHDGQEDQSSSVLLEKDMVSINQHTRTITNREYTPNVVEPSFGIGRILYALLEHSWWVRHDGRGVLSFPHAIAPVKVLVAPLSRHPDLRPLARQFASRLKALGIANRLDDSSTSIGRRYARADELGTPLGVTIDFQSLKDRSCTLRDRDTLEQVRASEDEICEAIENLVSGAESWEEVMTRLPSFES